MGTKQRVKGKGKDASERQPTTLGQAESLIPEESHFRVTQESLRNSTSHWVGGESQGTLEEISKTELGMRVFSLSLTASVG